MTTLPTPTLATKALRRAIGLILAFLCFPAALQAYPEAMQDYNHSEKHWRTAETEHFRFHYEKRLRTAAEACAARAEAIYPELVERFGVELPGKVDFLVFDEDYSNGWAIASLNTMAIWVADLGFNLRGTKDWLRDVVAHEFTHIASIRRSSKWKPWLPELQFGWGDGADGRISSGGVVLWSLNPHPMGLAEGTAQWGSEATGGDRWDTHRAMILRMAALSDSLLSWERMASFSGSGLDGEKVYNQGYSLVRHAAGQRGAEEIPRWWRELGRPTAQTAGGAWKRLTGSGGQALYDEWKQAVVEEARAVAERIGPERLGRKLAGQAFNTTAPRWLGSGQILFASNQGEPSGVNSLWAIRPDAAGADTAPYLVSPSIRSRVAIDTAAGRIFYASGREVDRFGNPVVELFAADLDTGKDGKLSAGPPRTHSRLTEGMHAFSPTLAPGGDTLAFVRKDVRRFILSLVPTSGGNLPPGEERPVFPRLSADDDTTAPNVFSASFSPDGKELAIDWFDGRLRRVDRVDREGRILGRLGDSLSEWREPWWAPDGKSVYLSSDRTGIFNIYRQDVASGALERLTNAVGGAFQPVPSPDGRRLVFIAFDRDGYSLYILDSLEVLPLGERMEPPAFAGMPAEDRFDFTDRETRYRPVPNRLLLTPILHAQRSAPSFRSGGDEWGWLGGARFTLLDPVRRNTLYGALLLDLSRGFDYFSTDYTNSNGINPTQEKVLFAGWENRSLRPTLTLEYSYQNLRGQDTLTEDNATGVGPEKILRQTPWGLQVQSIDAGARLQLTPNQKLHAHVARLTYDFQLVDEPFRFEAYRSLSPTAYWTYLDQDDFREEAGVDPRGLYARLQYGVDFSALQRSGTFAEVFEQQASGAIVARTNDYTVQRAAADVRMAWPNPLLEAHTIEADAAFSTLLRWDSDDADTLSDFFEEGIALKGYPAFVGNERRLFSGRHAAMLSLQYRFPVAVLRKTAWIWFVDALRGNVELQAGRAWSGDLWDRDRGALDQLAYDFARSVSVEALLTGRIHHTYPFDLFASFQTALDEPNGVRQEPVRLEVGPVSMPFGHRISFGINIALGAWSDIDVASRPGATPALPAPWRERPRIPSP